MSPQGTFASGNEAEKRQGLEKTQKSDELLHQPHAAADSLDPLYVCVLSCLGVRTPHPSPPDDTEWSISNFNPQASSLSSSSPSAYTRSLWQYQIEEEKKRLAKFDQVLLKTKRVEFQEVVKSHQRICLKQRRRVASKVSDKAMFSLLSSLLLRSLSHSSPAYLSSYV